MSTTALERQFRRLVEEHRAELHAHCYRMLGSLEDAEDALQDALLRAWRGLQGFEGRSSPRTWLYRIATNACLKAIERRPARPLDPYPDDRLGLADGYAAPEARYERRESVELAFIAVLQHLPATQRAVLILRDVLGFSAAETAEALDTTVASANSALQRARRALEQRLPERSQQATLRALGDQRLRTLVERYVDAWERGDAGAILSMLAEDATFAMPPGPAYHGRAAIAEFLPVGPLTDRWRFVPLRASGQPAFATYRWSAGDRAYELTAVDVLTLESESVRRITAFMSPELFPRFGLPGRLPPDR
jgi:RNA polymerase sigma-70 factor (ECF subfamily)